MTVLEPRTVTHSTLGDVSATLANGPYEAGRHSVTWDRRTATGSRAAAGVYTCRISTGERHEQRRMIVFP